MLENSSFFRMFYAQKVLCSEGPMFKRFYIQQLLCSEGSMFRRSYVQKLLCTECSMSEGSMSSMNIYEYCFTSLFAQP